jgi:hypothetical protein
MADLKLLDRVFYLITQHFVVTGQAPHYTELAKVLSLSVEESRKLLHELMEAPCPAYPSGTYRHLSRMVSPGYRLYRFLCAL